MSAELCVFACFLFMSAAFKWDERGSCDWSVTKPVPTPPAHSVFLLLICHVFIISSILLQAVSGLWSHQCSSKSFKTKSHTLCLEFVEWSRKFHSATLLKTFKPSALSRHYCMRASCCIFTSYDYKLYWWLESSACAETKAASTETFLKHCIRSLGNCPTPSKIMYSDERTLWFKQISHS